jgi:glutamate dehydrogenase
MTSNVPRRRLELIERIVRAAPRDAVRRDFMRSYFRGVGEQDLAAHSPADLAAIADLHLRIGQRRRPRRPLVTVLNPEPARDGFDTEHTLVAIVTDDMPFLVDSVNMVFATTGIAVHLIVHPVLQTLRDRAGVLTRLSRDPDPRSQAESWQLYLVDRQTDGARLEALVAALHSTLADVRAAVEDWRPMRERLAELAAILAAEPPRRSKPHDVEEARALLEWMGRAHFVLLGYRRYELRRGARVDRLVPDTRSGLGILRTARSGTPPVNELHGPMRALARDHSVVVTTKANAMSTVHRATHLDYVGVKQFDARGEPCGEHRFLGLWTSTAYFTSPRDIPLLRLKVAQVVAHFGLDPTSHDGKAVLAALETYPRDELFQASVKELIGIVRDVVNLYERRRTRLLVRRDPFGRFVSCMVYVPRDRYTTEVRQRIERILNQRFGGAGVESQVQISESNHARLHVVVRFPGDVLAPSRKKARRDALVRTVDIAAVEREIAAATETWADRLRGALFAAQPHDTAATLAARYAEAFPLAYQEQVGPRDALADIEDLERLGDATGGLRLNLHRPAGRPLSRVFLKIFKLGEAIPLSDLLPVMDHFGLRMIAERPYEVRLGDRGNASIQDLEFERHGGVPVAIDRVEERFVAGFLAVWSGEVDNDGFNRLLLSTRLDIQQIVVLRACARYLVQTGLPFSQSYMETTLAAHADVAADLFALFEQQFAPWAAARRTERCQRLVDRIRRRLDAVRGADEDRILRAFLALISALLRTNYYRRDAADDVPAGDSTRALAIKIDPTRIPELPLPRPRFEIFVYSPRVEGVHLRMGAVARGGIRWSDRREDYRTEILGLMKAQNVKNTLIVPVGAKGGFFPRRLPTGGSRDEIQREGIAAYRAYIGALLDVTDNLERGRVIPAPGVVRRDGDDPYLVVAADKGTASFSDTANAIAVARGFWLGDGFASGGSAGYDHKKMGITARGAWECVKRHFRELGIDIQSQDFTVAGIGDMSGDVFGNGMLLSPHIRLVAAFNHQHVFLDPAPDPVRSSAERRRLFELPRSSWEDYDTKLISPGGGVYPRSAKSIALSSEAQRLLDLPQATVMPQDVIRAILRMRVDLLWNGGIGTYIKARNETHADVGDRANDAVRVNGAELRARVVGEGGNLGFTQRGRVEYALAGGRINTDFIDNSAGVNTSDVEVNLKILLGGIERDGRLRRRDRDRLLARMTGAVAELVLRNNYLQSQALSLLERDAPQRLGELQQLIRALERAGELNRTLEHLPDDEAIEERRRQGRGLTRPELAVLLAYGKMSLYPRLLESDIPEDPYLSNELQRYFPEPVRRRFGRAIRRHPLRREIIATATTNSLVNRMGPSFVLRVTAETGADAAQIARAYTIAREAFGMRARWAAIEALDNRVAAAVQYEMMAALGRLLRHSTYWLLRQRDRSLAVEPAVRRLAPALARLVTRCAALVSLDEQARIETERARLTSAGVPGELAGFVACVDALDSALDIVEIAAGFRLPVTDAAAAYFALGERLGLDWLRRRIDELATEGAWQATARGGLREAALGLQRALTETALRHGGRQRGLARIDAWMNAASTDLDAWARTLTDLRAAGQIDFATLSVGIDAVRKLLR